MKESMGRTVSLPSNISSPKRLDPVASFGYGGAQQSEELDHWTIAQSNNSGVRSQTKPSNYYPIRQ